MKKRSRKVTGRHPGHPLAPLAAAVAALLAVNTLFALFVRERAQRPVRAEATVRLDELTRKEPGVPAGPYTETTMSWGYR